MLILIFAIFGAFAGLFLGLLNLKPVQNSIINTQTDKIVDDWQKEMAKTDEQFELLANLERFIQLRFDQPNFELTYDFDDILITKIKFDIPEDYDISVMLPPCSSNDKIVIDSVRVYVHSYNKWNDTYYAKLDIKSHTIKNPDR